MFSFLLISVFYHIFSVDRLYLDFFYLCLLVPKLYEQMHLFMILLVIHIKLHRIYSMTPLIVISLIFLLHASQECALFCFCFPSFIPTSVLLP
jgi:hypothetical protein